MATVGAGSPLQTIQYQAMPFQTMAYAPQILSQKHEAMQEQMDLLGAATPSDIPEEAQADVESYTKNIEDVTGSLAKDGYSFGMRNKLSGLRRDYIEKIKPIESYNQKKAELNQLVQKAGMNPDLIPLYNMPSYTDYRNGKTNYDFNVVSKGEYSKFGAAMAEQSSTPYARVQNGMLISGKRDKFHNKDGSPMNAKEIKSVIMADTTPEGMAIKKKLMADGFADPTQPGAQQALDAMVQGIMANRQAENISQYKNPNAGGSGTSNRPGYIQSNLRLTGDVTHDMANQLGVESIGQLEAVRTNSNISPYERAQAEKLHNKIINGLDKTTRANYERVVKNKPIIDEKIKNNLYTLGLEKDQVGRIEDAWQSIAQEYTDRSFIREVVTDESQFLTRKLAEAAGIEPFVGGVNPSLNPNIGYEGLKTQSQGTATDVINPKLVQTVKTLLPLLDKYDKWYDDEFKQIDRKVSKAFLNQKTQAKAYAVGSSTAAKEVGRMAGLMLESGSTGKNPEIKIGSVEVSKDGKDYELETSDKKSRESVQAMLSTGNILEASLVEAGEDSRPGVQLKVKYHDKIYRATLGFDAYATEKFQGLLQSAGEITDKGISPQAEQLLGNVQEYTLTQAFDQAGGQVSIPQMIGPIDKDASREVKALANGQIIRTSNGNYALRTDIEFYNKEFNKLTDIYNLLNQIVAQDKKQRQQINNSNYSIL